jgi:hypothetical protein
VFLCLSPLAGIFGKRHPLPLTHPVSDHNQGAFQTLVISCRPTTGTLWQGWTGGVELQLLTSNVNIALQNIDIVIRIS